MKTIIPVLAILTVMPHLALFAQDAAESSVNENKAEPAQNANPFGQPPNIRSVSQTAAIQKNQPSAGTAFMNRSGVSGHPYLWQNHAARFAGMVERPLVVRSLDMDPKDEGNLEEDLAVMARLLDKALEDLPGSQAHGHTAMGINLFVTPNSETKRSMYLEGYGALFLLNVGFPVVAPASSAQEEKPSGDSAWEEARQELYGQSAEPQTVTGPAEEFSEEKVSRLKETLLRALKNATNMRGLEGNITVCVLAGANLLPTRIWRLDGAPGGTAAEVLTANTDAAQSRETVLTIKVTKADVDAFAKGQLKFDDFRKRAKIAAYTTSASGPGAIGMGGLRFSGGGGFGVGGGGVAR